MQGLPALCLTKLRILKTLLWFRIMLPLLATLGPRPGWPIASVIGRWWARDYLPETVVTGNLSGRPFQVSTVYEEMCRQWAVASVINYSFPQWDLAYIDANMEIRGGGRDVLRSHSDGPAFFLSGHCFLMYAIVTLLGVKGRTVYAVSLDPHMTVPQYLRFVPDRIIAESTALLHGGGYLYTTLEGKYNRNIAPLMQKKTVYAAVDFPKNDFKGEWETVGFMGDCIEIPSRLFKFIIRHRIPAFFIHMRWDGSVNKIVCDVEKLSFGADATIKSSCLLFAHALEQRVIAYPGSWEGWKWANVLKSPQGDREAHAESA
ncbi:MAG: hypothetical protein HZB33_08210 [Nitrospirae bacterium]|nr:hypothetical protein [Nitrospirota bacterium]